MAEATIHITGAEVPGTNGTGDSETNNFHVIPAEQFGDNSTNNGTPSKPARERRREKRASLRVTDRREETSNVDSSEPDKKTPPPKTRKQVTEIKHYLTDTEALSNAKFYLAALETIAVSVSGPRGEMSEFERAMMTPALRRTLRRIPTEAMEKGNVVLDSILLVGGMTMYMNHAAGGFKWSWPFNRPQRKGVQTDRQSPVSQPMETVVTTTNTGDLDGLAVPVPEVFSRYMNGEI